MKVSDLKQKTPADLNEMVLDLMRELFNLRMKKGMDEVQKAKAA